MQNPRTMKTWISTYTPVPMSALRGIDVLRPSLVLDMFDDLVSAALSDDLDDAAYARTRAHSQAGKRSSRVVDDRTIEVELPRFKTEEIDLSFEGARLTLKASRKDATGEDTRTCSWTARGPISEASATLRAGVLTIKLDYAEKKTQVTITST